MFGAGWTEMLIIGVVALVVIGPKDLPIVMRKLGRVVATVRRMGTEFQREINKTTGLDSIAELKRSITEPLRQTSDEIVREFNKVTATGIEPSGVMKPLDPKVESVYDQIAATSGLPAAKEPSPAPAEASVAAIAATKPKRVLKPKMTPTAAAVAAKPAGPAKTKAAPAATTPAVRKGPTKAIPATPAEVSPPAPAAGKTAARPRAKAAAKMPAAAAAQPSQSVAMAANDAEPAKPVRARAKKA